jgi:PPK2 family polyphosphate:nucleotide phosphotransferase
MPPKPLSKIDLAKVDAEDCAKYTKDSAAKEYETLQKRLQELQERLYADGKNGLLIVLQAMDTGGKDGAIKAVVRDANPQGTRVASFKAPTSHELSHDFLWRVHQQVPPKGMIHLFNRSHYEDVLVVRVNNLVPEAQWSRYYDHINAFERLLHDNGTHIIKLHLHISKEEQRERLQARLDDPTKRWKFAMGDLKAREQWDDYQKAYEVMIERTNTEYAPWHIIPANKKWYRNLAVTQVVVQALETINPQYPTAEAGLEGLVIS